MAEKKRLRKANFSQNEIISLLQAVYDNKDTLLCQFSNEKTRKTKNDVWESIASTVSSVGVAFRSVTECRDKWKAMKSETLKRIADGKKTGGGRPAVAGPYEELVLKIIGEESAVVEGLQGKI